MDTVHTVCKFQGHHTRIGLPARAAWQHVIEETGRQLQLSAQRVEHWGEDLRVPRRAARPDGKEVAVFVELPPLPVDSRGVYQREVEYPSGSTAAR